MKLNLQGKTFGRWYVLEEVPNIRGPYGQVLWRCRCECGTERNKAGAELVRGASKSCGCLQRDYARSCVREKNPYWKGGRYHDKLGYVWVSGQDYPGKTRRHDQLEHVVIMARHLGRPLRKGETVHHKNGKRDDNRIENLELWSSFHPPGQRVQDRVVEAIEVLARYCPDILALPANRVLNIR